MDCGRTPRKGLAGLWVSTIQSWRSNPQQCYQTTSMWGQMSKHLLPDSPSKSQKERAACTGAMTKPTVFAVCSYSAVVRRLSGCVDSSWIWKYGNYVMKAHRSEQQLGCFSRRSGSAHASIQSLCSLPFLSDLLHITIKMYVKRIFLLCYYKWSCYDWLSPIIIFHCTVFACFIFPACVHKVCI